MALRCSRGKSSSASELCCNIPAAERDAYGIRDKSACAGIDDRDKRDILRRSRG